MLKCVISALSQQFTKPKDKLPPEQTHGMVYKICCNDCDFVYYGQTDRALMTRIKEHKRTVSHSDQYSKIAKHAEQYHHRFDFDNATIVNKIKNIRERLFLEAWYSLKDKNAGIDHIEIPTVYKTLFGKLTLESCIYYSVLNLVSHFNRRRSKSQVETS